MLNNAETDWKVLDHMILQLVFELFIFIICSTDKDSNVINKNNQLNTM